MILFNCAYRALINTQSIEEGLVEIRGLLRCKNNKDTPRSKGILSAHKPTPIREPSFIPQRYLYAHYTNIGNLFQSRTSSDQPVTDCHQLNCIKTACSMDIYDFVNANKIVA